MTIPQQPNQRWSLDFVSDVFAHGRRFWVQAVVDDFTAECLCLVADTSLSGARVARELDTVIAARKEPAMIVSDNGTELTSMTIQRWSQEKRVSHHNPAWIKIDPLVVALRSQSPRVQRYTSFVSQNVACSFLTQNRIFGGTKLIGYLAGRQKQ